MTEPQAGPSTRITYDMADFPLAIENDMMYLNKRNENAPTVQIVGAMIRRKCNGLVRTSRADLGSADPLDPGWAIPSVTM